MMADAFKVAWFAIAALLTFTPCFGDASYKPPRALDGKPSFEGTWTNASLTSLQRPAAYKRLVLDPSEVESATAAHPQVVRQQNDDGLGEDTEFDGEDLRGGRGYNAFWIDPGTRFAMVKGEYRTSWIVDPPDGQIPYSSGLQRGGSRNNFDGPEARPLGERCIVNSGSAGPPMTNYLYNNNYQIVQTSNSLAIRAEMNNYVRVVRIGGAHVHRNIRPLHGDSIGRWEGETLVVETTNFHPLHAQAQIALSDQARVIERFSRASDSQILYEFTVEDPKNYSRPWRGEMSFNATDALVYEYACHEGNYALTGILAGAREEEKKRGR